MGKELDIPRTCLSQVVLCQTGLRGLTKWNCNSVAPRSMRIKMPTWPCGQSYQSCPRACPVFYKSPMPPDVFRLCNINPYRIGLSTPSSLRGIFATPYQWYCRPADKVVIRPTFANAQVSLLAATALAEGVVAAGLRLLVHGHFAGLPNAAGCACMANVRTVVRSTVVLVVDRESYAPGETVDGIVCLNLVECLQGSLFVKVRSAGFFTAAGLEKRPWVRRCLRSCVQAVAGLCGIPQEGSEGLSNCSLPRNARHSFRSPLGVKVMDGQSCSSSGARGLPSSADKALILTPYHPPCCSSRAMRKSSSGPTPWCRGTTDMATLG